MVMPEEGGFAPSLADSRPRELILCVDDEAAVLAVLKEQLEDAFGEDCEVEAVTSGAEALALLDGLDPESEALAVVIADQIMPGISGTELLAQVTKRAPEALKILLTGQAGLDAVVMAINTSGLHQYIAKPWSEPDLRLAVAGLLERYRLSAENGRLLERLKRQNAELERFAASLEEEVRRRTRELEEANAQLAKLAVTDGLTGLFNHRHFQERLAGEVERTGRTGEPVTLLMIDVDHFKAYNDTHGHQAGDKILCEIASLLGTGRRVNDVVARYGGEEFAILLSGTERKAGALVAEYLRRRVAERGFPGGETQPGGRLTISIGVASSPDDARDPRALLRAADVALYQAKALGRNRVVSTTS
ncbi:MAG: diguanylate cyclase [Polyangia bacterium]|jgi:diguanylate cyclase (GGDEF)-like protein|nr:diguanylate cyclase [Polyangia bacterium]